jgi:hypothetical protein
MGSELTIDTAAPLKGPGPQYENHFERSRDNLLDDLDKLKRESPEEYAQLEELAAETAGQSVERGFRASGVGLYRDPRRRSLDRRRNGVASKHLTFPLAKRVAEWGQSSLSTQRRVWR